MTGDSETISPARWWAIIGIEPTPAPTGVSVTWHDKARRLARPLELAPLVVRSGDQQFVEYVRSTPNDLDGWTCYQSWPLIVQGPAAASVSLEFDGLAFADVRRVAALVALAWREPWSVRTGPTRAANRAPTVPESDLPPPMWYDEPVHVDPVDVALPDWINRAWRALKHDQDLAAALLSWHEGILIEAAHPSLALVAYTAAVEATAGSTWGRRAAPPTEPVRCNSCGFVQRKTTRRFRALIEYVADVEQQRLLKGWYGFRSSTAHGGRHHGVESAFGAIFDLGPTMTMPNVDTMVGDLEVQEFVRVVVGARRAAGDLLVAALSEAAR